MVLATPAMTPAVAPEANDFFSVDRSGATLSARNGAGQQANGLRSIPVSPLRTTGPSLVDEPTVNPSKPTSPVETTASQPGSRDYFSLRGSKTTPARRSATETGADEPAPTPLPAGSEPPATPGGTLMGRFKGFGKGKKTDAKGGAGAATPAPVVEVSEEEQKRLEQEAKVRADHLSPSRDTAISTS